MQRLSRLLREVGCVGGGGAPPAGSQVQLSPPAAALQSRLLHLASSEAQKGPLAPLSPWKRKAKCWEGPWELTGPPGWSFSLVAQRWSSRLTGPLGPCGSVLPGLAASTAQGVLPSWQPLPARPAPAGSVEWPKQPRLRSPVSQVGHFPALAPMPTLGAVC